LFESGAAIGVPRIIFPFPFFARHKALFLVIMGVRDRKGRMVRAQKNKGE
jgi:hypothetical protein